MKPTEKTFENDRSQIIQQLYNIELLLHNLLDSSYDGITITDGNARTIWYNNAYLRISGLNPSILDDHKIDEIIEKGFLKYSVSMDAFTQKKAITKLNRYPTGIEALVTSTPVFDDAGNLLYIISNVRDLTELNKLKRQLDESTNLAKIYRQTLQEIQLNNADGNQIIFRSPIMEKLISLIHKFAIVDTPVLILGESGVGKDVLANYIHYVSDRNNKGPFVKVNCGAIPEHLLESELFGYEAGAFTGAARQGKAGLFEVADKGTLFLDEIGEMPLSLQVKLLGVLQDMRIQRVGGTKPITIDVRVIAATNANLDEKIAEKQFREDLFFRINVLSINVPPLRERPEDIFILLMHFLRMFNTRHGMNKTLSSAVIDLLLSYPWPGNIRELKNVIERLVVISDDDMIHDSLLPPNILKNKTMDHLISQDNLHPPALDLSLKEVMNEHEKKVLSIYLSKYRPLKHCAEKLGIDLATLVRKKKRYGL